MYGVESLEVEWLVLFFLEGNLTGDRYSVLLQREFLDLIEDFPIQLRRDMLFQQDACPSHTSRMARAVLNDMFPKKWIGKFGPINFPPRSPDLTVLDYFLWGRIKNLVYNTRPTTRDDMINRITEAIQSLNEAEILRATNSFQRRVNLCIGARGQQFEQFN